MTVYPLQGKPPYATNCYLLISEETPREAILVDGSVTPAQLQPLLHRQQATLRAVLLTHGHADHLEQLTQLQAEFAVPVFLSDRDAALYRVAGTQDYSTGFGFCAALRPQVLAVPGHTPGSVCFGYPGVVFCGDTLFAGSVGRTDLPGGDTAALFTSLRQLGGFLQQEQLRQGEVALLPGHGKSTTFTQEKVTNPYLRQAMR